MIDEWTVVDPAGCMLSQGCSDVKEETHPLNLFYIFIRAIIVGSQPLAIR
jgi:hypothetical protein